MQCPKCGSPLKAKDVDEWECEVCNKLMLIVMLDNAVYPPVIEFYGYEGHSKE